MPTLARFCLVALFAVLAFAARSQTPPVMTSAQFSAWKSNLDLQIGLCDDDIRRLKSDIQRNESLLGNKTFKAIAERELPRQRQRLQELEARKRSLEAQLRAPPAIRQEPIYTPSPRPAPTPSFPSSSSTSAPSYPGTTSSSSDRAVRAGEAKAISDGMMQAYDQRATLYQVAVDVKRQVASAPDIEKLMTIADSWDSMFRAEMKKRKPTEPFESGPFKIAKAFELELKKYLIGEAAEKLTPELVEWLKRLPKLPHTISLVYAFAEQSAPDTTVDDNQELLELNRGVQIQIQRRLQALMPAQMLSVVASVSHDLATKRGGSYLSADSATKSGQKPRSSNSRSYSIVDCSILQDPARSAALLASDPDAWQKLVDACDGKRE